MKKIVSSRFYERYWLEKPDDQLPDLKYKWPTIQRMFPRIRNANIVDYGSGTGVLLQRLTTLYPDNNYVGLDVSDNAIARAKKRLPHVTFKRIVADATIPLNDNSVDVLISCDVVEHVYDTQKLFSEFSRIIKPGGIVLITTPYHGLIKNLVIALLGFETVFDPTGPHIRFFSRKSLNKCLTDCGFVAVNWQYFGRFIPVYKGMAVVAIKK